MVKVLVTGASGFVGQHLVVKLAHDYDVCVVVRGETTKIQSLSWYPHVELLKFDLDQIETYSFGSFGIPDIVIHLAWSQLGRHTDPIVCEQNLKRDFVFLRTMLNWGVKHILVAGTCFEYGNREGELVETAPLTPTTFYGLAKATLFQYASLLCAQEKDVIFQWARLFYLYAKKNHTYGGVLGQLEETVKKGEPSFKMTDGHQSYDYIDINYACDKMIRLIKQTKCIGATNICTGRQISVYDLITRYIKDNNMSIKLEKGLRPSRPYDAKQNWGSTKKFDSYCV